MQVVMNYNYTQMNKNNELISIILHYLQLRPCSEEVDQVDGDRGCCGGGSKKEEVWKEREAIGMKGEDVEEQNDYKERPHSRLYRSVPFCHKRLH